MAADSIGAGRRGPLGSRGALSLSLVLSLCLFPGPQTADCRPLASPSPSPYEGGITVRAGTFNVLGGDRGSARAIGAVLRVLDLAWVGLQECPADLGRDIAREAGYPYVAGDGNVLLSRTPLQAPRRIPLGGGRFLVHATTVFDGVPFSIYVAHLGWNTDGVRQARRLLDEVLPADPVPHLVLVGDFNDERHSVQIGVLESALAEAFATLGWRSGERISWPATGFGGSEGAQLIDQVWFRRDFPALVLDGDVVNLSPPLSDHKPAWAELRFPRDPGAPYPGDPLAPLRDPLRALPPEGSRPRNLLANPGAEDGLAGWTTGGDARAETGRANQAPRSGRRMFAGSPAPDPAAPWSWGSQTVDLSGAAVDIDASRGVAFAAGWLASGHALQERDGVVANVPVPYDDGELIVEALDAGGAALARLSSGRQDPLRFDAWAGALDLPPGTRAARLTWLAHHKAVGGPGNDAFFDDLYLAFGSRPTPLRLRSGDLVPDGGAESALLPGWEANAGWAVVPDQAAAGPWGDDPHAPGAWSGRAMLYGAPADGGPADVSVTIALGPHRDAVAAGGLSVRWGGRLRTFQGTASGRILLEVRDGTGALLDARGTTAVRAAEWTGVEVRTPLPPGSASLRLTVRAENAGDGDGVFADDVFAMLEGP